MSKALDRNLDGLYFRVKRGGRFESVCFSDLTKKQMRQVLEGNSKEFLREMCVILGLRIRRIGDELDIAGCDAE